MNDAWVWWLFAIGLAVGAAAVWFVRGRIARGEDDLAADERALEAGWIADTIERSGGVAPVQLVEQILELHRDYVHSSPPYLEGDPPLVSAAAADREAGRGVTASPRPPAEPGS